MKGKSEPLDSDRDTDQPIAADSVIFRGRRDAPRGAAPDRTRPRWRRQLLWALVGFGIAVPIVAGLVTVKLLQFRAMDAARAQQVVPPQPVNAIEVREAPWQPRLAAVGSVTAVQGTVISTEVEGVVREIRFDAGARVNAGDVLVQLDAEVEQAQLRAAEAAAELARASQRRAQGLIASRSIAQAEVDAAESAFKQAEAQVDNLRAIIAKKTVRAPFSGRLGIRQISVGQFLTKGSPVVSLQSLDPVYVDFSLPQQRLGDLAEGLKVVVSTDAYPGQPFEGPITAINPHVDPATRNVRVQATLPNPESRLRPGMFVTVEVVSARSQPALFIPLAAVLNGPFGDSVFAIAAGPPGSDGTASLVVEQRIVRLGARQGDFVIVTEGVKAGDRIVSTGAFKLKPGMPVVIDNTLAPQFALVPKAPNN